MSMQRLQDTDAYILRQFDAAVAHLKGLPVKQIQADMLRIGTPFLNRLKANGHDGFDALDLMRRTFTDRRSS